MPEPLLHTALPAIALAGPTASGKTAGALALAAVLGKQGMPVDEMIGWLDNLLFTKYRSRFSRQYTLAITGALGKNRSTNHSIGGNIQDRRNPKDKFSQRFDAPGGTLDNTEVQTDTRSGDDYSFNLDYSADIGPGQLEMDLQWSHLLKFERTSGGSTDDFLGTHGNCDVTNCIGTPKDRVNFGTTWKQGAWSVSGVANYIAKMDNTDKRGGDYQAFYADGTPVKKISSFTTFDLSGRWNVTDMFELNASVQNVFDREYWSGVASYGAFSPGYPRTLQLSATVDF